MFWRFGFSSVSTLETLLDKPNVTLEDVLDEDDLLQECKSQNHKLINYLRQPRIVKRLMDHVVGSATVGGTSASGKEWEEKVKFKYPYVASEVLSCSELWPIIDAIFSDTKEYLVPFWDAVLTASPMPSQPPLPIHSHPLFAESHTPAAPSATSAPHHISASHNDFSGTNAEGRASFDADNKSDRLRATNALDNGPGRGVLAGYWAKVNGAYLERKPVEMVQFIKEQPHIVQRFVAHLETPAVVDLLFRIIQMEENTRSPAQSVDIINWLSSQELISQTVELLAPKYSVDIHNTVSELLKAIIALSAPSPAVLNQGQSQDLSNNAGVGGDSFSQDNITGINNRLVRELASESIVRKMVGYMLDFQMPRDLESRLTDVAGDRMAHLTLTEEKQKVAQDDYAKADDEDDSFALPLNPRDFPASETHSPALLDKRGTSTTDSQEDKTPTVVAPTVKVTAETCSSTLVTCIGVFIELIRKNNSDYFEQHLLRTLHNHLVKRQSELTEQRLNRDVNGANQVGTGGKDNVEALDEEEEDVQGMEEAMAEIVDKMGLVHLGPMLKVLSERLAEFQQLVKRPRDNSFKMQTSVGELSPLTFERYRITELYAELLHCSNMALLNRAPGEGPQYSDDGVLTGGLDGLQILARTLQGNENAEVTVPSAAVEVNVNADQHNNTEQETAGLASSTNAESSESTESAAFGVSSSLETSNGIQEEGEDDALLKEVSLGGKGKETTDAVADQAALTPEVGSKAEHTDSTSLQAAITADETSTRQSSHTTSDSLVAGDLLKDKFLECKIMPSLLDLFFNYPWNNFLHNVVYDILQQCFNGRMDVGLNRDLTVAVFDQGHLTDRIVEGRNRNETSMAGPRRIRLGFMGHMNLIAEEAVKLLERYPSEIAGPVEAYTERQEWQQVVADTLEEIREKEGGPLAFNRGGEGTSMSFGSGADDDEDSGLGAGGPGSSSFASYLSSQIGGGAAESDDDEDDSDEEAPWLSNEMKRAGSGGARNTGFEDTFVPSHGDQGGSGELGDDDDDDEWGPFADPSDPHSDDREAVSGQPFGATGMASGASASFSNPFSENLTPADWSAQFRREYHDDDRLKTTQLIAVGADDEEDQDDEEATASESTASSDDAASSSNAFVPGAMSMPGDAVAKAHARRPSLTHLEAPDGTLLSTSPSNQSATGSGPRRLSGGDDTLSAVTDTEDPLGPGIPTEVEQTSEGLLQRTLADGTKVTVPLDEIALGAP